MADTQSLVDRGTLPGERPYTTADEKTNQMKGLTNMGSRQEPPPEPTPPETPPTPGQMRFPLSGRTTQAPGQPQMPDSGPQALEESRRRFIAENAPTSDALAPFAEVLAPVKGALDGIGSLIVGGLSSPAGRMALRQPKVGGALKVAGAVGGAIGTAMQAPLGAEAVAADVAGAVTGKGDTTGEFGRAYLRGSNYPEDNPMAAVLHGFQAAEEQRMSDLGQTMVDPQKPVGERFRAALGGGLAMLIEQAVLGPEVAVGEAAIETLTRAAARGSGAVLAVAERSIGEVAPGAGAFASRQSERVTAARKLPEELARAKPRFGRTEVTFESDIDKALYIVGNSDVKSARDAEYLDYLKQHFPNATEGEIRTMGKQVRDELKKVKAAKGEDEYTRTLPTTTMAKQAEGAGEATVKKGPSVVNQWRTYQGPPVKAKYLDTGKAGPVIKAGTPGFIVSEEADGTQIWQFDATSGRVRAKIKPTGEAAAESVDPIEARAQAAAQERAAAEADLAKAKQEAQAAKAGGKAPLGGKARAAEATAPAPSLPVGEQVEYGTKTGRASGTLVGKDEDGHYIIDIGGGKTVVRRRIHRVRDAATKEVDDSEIIASIDESSPPEFVAKKKGTPVQASAKKDVQRGESAKPPAPPSKPPAPPAAAEPPPEPSSRRPTPTTSERTYMTPEDAAKFAETVPLSERNAVIDEITGGRINTSSMDATVAAHFADAMLREPEKFTHFTDRISDPELIQRAANYLGLTTDQMNERLIQMGFGKPGEMASFLYAANVRTVQLIDDFARAASISPEAEGEAYATLVEFSTKVAGANSEVGRTLRMMKLQRQLSLTGALRARETYASADRAVRESEKEGEKIARRMASAVGKGDFDAAKVITGDQRRWESKMEKARADRQTAKEELLNAGKKAKAQAYRRVVDEFDEKNPVAIAILKADPSDPVAIAQLVGKTQKYTLGEKYITAVMSGAYSGPLGHVRSAIGASLNLTDEVVTSGLAELLHLPGFTAGEFKSRLFGLQEASRTYFGDGVTRGMIHDYWVSRVSPENITGAKGMEDIFGPVLTGKARPFGLMLEAHGFYHASGYHFILKSELYSLLHRRAVTMLGGKADNASVAELYHQLVTNIPADIMDQAVKVASNRRYLAKQAGIYEKLLGVVSAEFGPGQLKAAWLRPYFVAARFGIGFAGRQVEFGLGGGLARAGKIALHDIPHLEDQAIQQQARLRAITELGADAPKSALNEKTAQIIASKDPGLREEAMRSISTERDFLMREASKAGIRGFVGAGLFAGGYMLAASGKIHRDGFETWADTPLGPMNLTWLMPYSAPFVFASILYDAKSKGQLQNPEEDLQATLGAIRALSQNVVEGDSLFQVTTLDDVLNGRANRKAYQQLGQVAARLAVPGFSVVAREADRILDGGAKDPHTWDEYMRYYMPLARRALRPKLDLTTGEELPDQPQGLARLNPAGVQTAPPTTPVAEQNKKFMQADPSYKGLQAPTKTWGKDQYEVKLDEQQEWEYTKKVGQVRSRVLSALLQDPKFTQEKDPKKQKELWDKADVAARREARRDYAVTLMRTADPGNIVKYAKAAIDANGTGRTETALWLLGLQNDHELTPSIEAALDKVIRENEAKTKSNITIGSYKEVMKDVSDYLHIAPFSKGGPEQWQQYQEQKKEYNALNRQDYLSGVKYYQQHPLLREYDAAVNIQRNLFLARHPKIQRFVEGTQYTWLR